MFVIVMILFIDGEFAGRIRSVEEFQTRQDCSIALNFAEPLRNEMRRMIAHRVKSHVAISSSCVLLQGV